MNDERLPWPLVKELFHAALALEPTQRAAFLLERCPDDAALRAEVTSLLDAHAAAGHFVETPIFSALTDGMTFGAYRIVSPLDAGGMGEVYRALDTRLQRPVAVKVLPAALAGRPDLVARIEREARMLAAVDHPHIATIHGFEIVDGIGAVVMELIDGPTLGDRLAGGPLPVDEALTIARQIAEALEAAHEKGIIHRDLKPANIKFTASGAAKVLDFGLAKAIAPRETGDRSPVDASAAGTLAGTPAYMSPEQARGQRVDERTDVWAFGCIVYEMLTGHQAFGQATVAESFAAVLEREPEWNRLPDHVPPAVRRVLRRCLAKDRRARLHHIADARIEIEDAAAEPVMMSPVASVAPARRWSVPLSLALLVLALGATLAVLWRRPPADSALPRVAELTTPWSADLWAFAVSPDGRRIAYVADDQGQPALWVRELNATSAHVLPGTERARGPFWSPDSHTLGYFADSDLKRVDIRGGRPQTITYALAGTTGAWAPDGTILFSSTPVPALRRVNASGGPVEVATSVGGDATGHNHPQFLPDGRQFLFFVGGSDAVRGVYIGSLDSPEVVRLRPSDTQGSYLTTGWLLFVRQGALLAQRFDLSQRSLSGDPVIIADTVGFDPVTGRGAFSTSDAGVMAYRAGRSPVTRLAWFDRSGTALATLGPAEQSGLSTFMLSPDARRAAAERTLHTQTDVWLLDGAGQTRLTHAADGTVSRAPVWSRDGARLAIQSVESHAVRLSMIRLPGDGEADVLVESPEVKVPCDWSPDGRILMYYVPDPKTGTDLWTVSATTRKPELYLRTPANELWGQFSPDGRWVAYQSNETGVYEIYIRPFAAPGEPVPVSVAGGVYPRWSRDGRELYYIAPDARLMAVPIKMAGTAVEAGPPAALFQTKRVGGGTNVIGRGHQYDVARDGRFLINTEAESSAPPLTLLLNWTPQ